MKRKMTGLILAAVVFLTGCGNQVTGQSAGEIAEKMQSALEKTPCTQMEMKVDISMSVELPGEGEIPVGVTATTENTLQQEPASSYSVSRMETKVMGQSVKSEAVVYLVSEDGKAAIYTRTDGVWTRSEVSIDVAKTRPAGLDGRADQETVAVDEKVKEYQGKQAVCLTKEASGEDMEALMDAMLHEMAGSGVEGGEIDWSAISSSSKVYLDAKTYLPMAEEMTIRGMEEAMAPMFENLGTAVKIENCSVAMTYSSYEEQEPIVLPEGVREKAAAWEHLLAGNPDNGDGTYTLREGRVLADVKTPEGFQAVETGYDSVKFQQEGKNRQITYTMYYADDGTDSSGNCFRESIDEYEKCCKEVYGEKTERKQAKIVSETILEYECDFLDTTSETGHKRSQWYAWYPITFDETGRTYYLHVEVVDGYLTGSDGAEASSADITEEEFMSYLKGAALNDLIEPPVGRES